MSNNIIKGTPVPNRDIFVSDTVLSLYPELKSLLGNKEIEVEFAKIDRIARRRKRTFNFLGTVSLILVCGVLLSLAWRLSLLTITVTIPLWLEEFSGIAGILAVGIQLTLFLSGLNRKWIFARFMAERIRLWKYQLLLDGEFVAKCASVPAEQFNEELHARLVVFCENFKHGIGGMNVFIDPSSQTPITKPKPYLNQDLILKVRDAYLMLRLDVQISHFEDKNEHLEPLDKLTDSWAKVLLELSGLIAVAEALLVGGRALGVQIFSAPSSQMVAAILAGLALSLAIVSSAIRVYRGGSMIVEERERYHAKQRHLSRIRDRIVDETAPNKILSLMEEAEIVCTKELREFVSTLRRGSYFL